jgi:hypothetical protein
MEDGVPQTGAQPPFLLRFSPQLFAAEASAMFQHDPVTNRLSIKEGMTEPWLRNTNCRAADAHKSTWNYCVDCHDRHFGTKRGLGIIPYRDKASQWLMKKPAPREAAESATQASEPEQEPMEEPMDLMDVDHDVFDHPDEGVDVEAEQEIGAPDEEEVQEDLPEAEFPTLEEYLRKWESGLAQHSRANPDDFSRDNLVPEPIPQLWQDVVNLAS